MTHSSHRSTPLISMDSVGKTYPDGNVEALKDVCLEIAAGEFVTIVGRSGCGKSTLLNLTGGLDTPTKGNILYSGQSLESAAQLDRFRSRQVGFVFQTFYLLPNLTAIENVQIPMFEGELRPAAREQLAKDLLAQVGLADRSHHLPNQLSIGQRQRVAIARSLANRPTLILADEPTGSLDSVSGGEVLELLLQIREAQQCTLLIVTHDGVIAARGERQIHMRDGRIVQDQLQS